MHDYKPILAPKPLTAYSPAEWKDYVISLHRAPEKKVSRVWNFRINDKGTPIITIRGRKPKYLYKDEFEEFLTDTGFDRNEGLNLLFRKQVEIKDRIKGKK
jgi:hypothetical protein